jgi:predicted RecB family nuclease
MAGAASVIRFGESLQLSATDLVGHLNCRHLTNLDVEVANGTLAKPKVWDPLLEILWERGAAHERSYVEHLNSHGYDVTEIETTHGITAAQVGQTLAAMRAGAQIIVQGAFVNGVWSGRTDILTRVSTQSALGDWSYEVIDTKLARETKGGTVLQLCLYSDLLQQAQGVLPEYMYVVTPGSGFEPERYRTAAFRAYYRSVKRGLEQALATRQGISTYPEPREHCDICRWRSSCEARRRADDHLCLVAGISRIQVAELNRHDVGSVAELAAVSLPWPWKPERGSRQTYERTREQARMQVQGRTEARPVYEAIAPTPTLGLARLPAPSAGDVFFDIEGDPFVGDAGLEYLFGYVFADDGAERYVGEWALDAEEEKRAFERFIDFIMARSNRYPDMHIYHYAPYEPSALKRLMGRYATREDEVDRILRGELFVDLYSVIRQGIRASVEHYSIKDLEVFYGFARTTTLADARRALMLMQAALELNDPAGITPDVMSTIAGYNREDCVSAQRLRDWLEHVRADLIQSGASIDRPAPPENKVNQDLEERQRIVAELISTLTADVPVDVTLRLAEQQARWILAHTLDWHRRELKSVWWEYFRLADLAAEDLLDERAALAGLEFVTSVGGTARAPIHRYRFPQQETELRGGESLHSVGGEKYGSVVSVSQQDRTIDIKKRIDTAASHAAAVFAHDIVGTDEQAAALLRMGEHVAVNGLSGSGPYQAARDLLQRLAPRISGEPLRKENETTLEAATRVATMLEPGVLAIQGPPGAGKTFTAARMICALVMAGKTVGVTANSHKVIRNLLNAVVRAADEQRIDLICLQKAAEKEEDVHRIHFARSNEEVLSAIGHSCQVAGGTAWLWSRKEFSEAVDVLFVDEAGQMSLANVLAISQACKSLVLLGDPQQLEQPTQGSHPDGVGVSALEHLLGGHATIGNDQGLFLEQTWRLHPQICAFTSELFYEGRLNSHRGLEQQTIDSTGRLRGSGLRFLPIRHEGNQNASPEEADLIRTLVNEILGTQTTWTNHKGELKLIGLDDILIIAPYNAQAFELQERLPGARVGTVDKFQGQEAPIVFYSMTTSSHADAPRGMEFLYSLNRLNVATSRARCICALVGSPLLFEPECKTPRQMQMANAFCRYLERAEVIPYEG